MLNPCYEVFIGGYRRRLRNTLKAWLLFERKTGRQMGDVGGGPEILRALLWALLQTEHPEMHVKDVGSASAFEFRELLQAAESCIRGEFPLIEEEPQAGAPQRIDWHDLWSIGRYDLRLSDDEFWMLSPRQFHHLMLRFDAANDRVWLAAGITAAAFVNCHIDPEKGEPISPEQFIPKRVPAGQKHAEKSVNVMAQLREVATLLPGTFGKLESV